MDEINRILSNKSKGIGEIKMDLEGLLVESRPIRITFIEYYFELGRRNAALSDELKWSRVTTLILFGVVLWLIFSK